MAEQTTVPSLRELLDQSSATDEFKSAVKELEKGGKPDDVIISMNQGAPPVKVLRTIMQLLDQYSDWEVSKIKLAGQSGCSDFRGELSVTLGNGEMKHVEFAWDCAWKANQVGYKNFWGDPDQQKAAREFGYQCFEKFDVK